jgi:hypothetical protein
MPSEGHRPKRASECPKQKAPLSAGLNLGESECKAETLADSPEPLKPLLLGSNLLGQDGRRKVKQPMASHKGSFPSGLMSACGTKRTWSRRLAKSAFDPERTFPRTDLRTLGALGEPRRSDEALSSNTS